MFSAIALFQLPDRDLSLQKSIGGQSGVLTSARALWLDSFRITVHRHTNSKDTQRKNKIRLALSFVERKNIFLLFFVSVFNSLKLVRVSFRGLSSPTLKPKNLAEPKVCQKNISLTVLPLQLPYYTVGLN